MITTKKGDSGMTDYFGKRVRKDADEIELLGNLDELQAALLIINYRLKSDRLKMVVGDLGKIMGKEPMGKKIKDLENEIDRLWKELRPKEEFVVFGKEESICINWVRTVARRAERRAVSLQGSKEVIIYLNRLSDYLYLLAIKEEK